MPHQPGYNKRLRKLAGTLGWLVGVLALEYLLWSDDVWVVTSTRVEGGRSRETARRSQLAGWAAYGRASHCRYFWAATSKPSGRSWSGPAAPSPQG